MLNRMVFSISALSFIFIMACSSDNVAGGTIDPNSIAEISSSSEGDGGANAVSSDVGDISSSSKKNDRVESSSSNLPNKGLISSSEKVEKVESSSSYVPDPVSSSSRSRSNNGGSQDGGQNGLVPNPISSDSTERDVVMSSSGYSHPVVHAENFSLQCKEEAVYGDGNAPDDAPPSPSASFYVYNEAEVITFENVYFDIPCNKEKRTKFLNDLYENGTDVSLDGDTVFVNLPQTESINCGCVAEGGFRLDKYYPDINYAVFNQQNAIQLYEMHYTLVEDVEGHN
ncbi:MAG: hypothetical protein J5615_02885 [Fibrobacter sp.]|nr:hypothetical protein [Fibrobacter sp.]